jgi:hypothetical protein
MPYKCAPRSLWKASGHAAREIPVDGEGADDCLGRHGFRALFIASKALNVCCLQMVT